MTGIELLKSELKAKGFTPSKIAMNEQLIYAVVEILSDEETRKEIDIAKEYAEKAKQAEMRASQEKYSAEKAMFEAREKEREAKLLKEKTDEKLDKINSKTLELNSTVSMILDLETAEARDKAKLMELFYLNIPKSENPNAKAIIYSMGNILGTGAAFNLEEPKNGREKRNAK